MNLWLDRLGSSIDQTQNSDLYSKLKSEANNLRVTDPASQDGTSKSGDSLSEKGNGTGNGNDGESSSGSGQENESAPSAQDGNAASEEQNQAADGNQNQPTRTTPGPEASGNASPAIATVGSFTENSMNPSNTNSGNTASGTSSTDQRGLPFQPRPTGSSATAFGLSSILILLVF